MLKKFSCTPRAPRVNSLSYLGHGRMGHLPDLGYLQYTYRPVWSAEMVSKNNPQDFRRAYCQMVHVLTCIRMGQVFDFDAFQAAEAGDNEAAVEEKLRLLTQKGNEAGICVSMKAELGDELPDYSHEAYFEGGQRWESLGRFFDAARSHKEMVLASFPSIAQ